MRRAMSFAIAMAIVPIVSALAATTNVTVGPGFSFSPSSVTVAPGDTVVWTFAGTHTTTSDTGIWDSGIMSSGTFPFVFNAPGDYPYYCSLHSFPGGTFMNGIVHVVEPAIAVNIDANANRHAIDPRIYGAAYADATTITNLGLTLNRWGGNRTTRYNWQIATSNTASDYYFENIPEDPGGTSDAFITNTKGAGAQPIITIPMIGWVPKDNQLTPRRCSYDTARFPQATFPQNSYDPFASQCGDGFAPDGITRLTGADPTDTSVAVTSLFQAAWVQHLVDTFGAAGGAGVKYYSLDNEPSLWSSTHFDVHPAPMSYDEAWTRMSDYGAAIRAKDANALITGPEEWGWTAYFDSTLDWDNGNTNDRVAHGNVPYIEWLLQQAKAYELAHGARILDVVTVHFYPQSGEFGTDVSPATQGLRNRSTRSLWDPAYVDESWIGTTGINSGIVKLIPMMKQWVSTNYPGTKIGLTEYNWGADTHINGGTAQADILGILGREGADVGVRWTAPPSGSFTASAFKMYRNYDGAHAAFGDTSVSASGPDPDSLAVFAAVRSSDKALTLMLVAKTTSSTPANVNLANFVAMRSAAVQRWQLDSTNTITHQPDLALSGSSIPVTLPAQTITLLVVPAATAPGPPLIGTATPHNQSATISFTPPANDGGSTITNYMATCNPGTISGSAAVSPVTVNGLTNNVAYDCSVVAINAAGTSAPSSTVSVTPLPPFGTPASFVATAISTSQVALSWSGVADTTGYEIDRSSGGAAFAFLTTTAATAATYTDNGLVDDTSYLYKLRALGSGSPSPFTAVDPATTTMFANEPLTAGTLIQAVHIAQLRIAVNAMRAAAGLQSFVFTDGTVNGATIKAIHLTQLRSALDEARSTIGLSAISYADSTIMPNVTTVKTTHISNLRSGVQ